MLEQGYLMNAQIPYGEISNAERQRRQVRRTRWFLEELGVEQIAIGQNDAEQQLYVSGFIPQQVVSTQRVEALLHDLGAVSTSFIPGTVRRTHYE